MIKVTEVRCSYLKSESDKAQKILWEITVSAQSKTLSELEEFVKKSKLTTTDVVYKIVEVLDSSKTVPEIYPKIQTAMFYVTATRQTADDPAKVLKSFEKC